MNFSDIRRDYVGEPLSETESDPDPFQQFTHWFAQAQITEPDPTAMALATAGADGRATVRTVLLKGVDDTGFVFYTNYHSAKGRDIAATPHASLLFYWSSLNRQVRVSGSVDKVSPAESDAYFATRPVESRWSVYASNQSEVVLSREALEMRYHAAQQRYGDNVPRPDWWGGYRVLPETFEFWQGRPGRLHDRVRYVRASEGWRRQRLAP